MSSRGALIALVAVCLHALSSAGAALPPPASTVAETAAVKAAVSRRGIGQDATVTVAKRDGSRLEGYVSAARAESFTVIDARERATVVGYRDVATIGRGRPDWAQIFDFLGAAATAVTSTLSNPLARPR